MSGLSGFLGFDFAGSTGGLPVRIASIEATNSGVGNGEIEPDVVLRVAQLLAEHAEQMALQIGERAARGAGVVRHRVEHVDRALIGRFVSAAASVERGDGRDRAVLHAGRLLAGRDAEQIAEGQHSRALAGGSRLGQIEVRQVLSVDFEQGQLEPRVGVNKLPLIFAPVVEDHRHFVDVEHVAPNRQHVAIGGKKKPALIDFEAVQAAGAKDLDDLRLDLAADAGQRRAGEGGPGEKQRAGEEQQCDEPAARRPLTPGPSPTRGEG